MTFKLSDAKPGDKITVEFTVGRVADGHGDLVLAVPGVAYLSASAIRQGIYRILNIETPPKLLEVGDRVLINTIRPRPAGRVLAIDGGYAWVRGTDATGGIFPLSDLEPAP